MPEVPYVVSAWRRAHPGQGPRGRRYLGLDVLARDRLTLVTDQATSTEKEVTGIETDAISA